MNFNSRFPQILTSANCHHGSDPSIRSHHCEFLCYILAPVSVILIHGRSYNGLNDL
ncbi:hypothetical protein BJX96DRAFT_149191, partial [Aspergillus floccosus]